MDFLVGIIVSVYMLAMKEQSLARCCKLLYGVCKDDHARWIARAVRRADGIFSGFVRGKLLDSLIIGILCLIGCTLLKMPYAPLVSLIVGVTNVIPFFGPFMGAVPSAFLILLVSPKKCLFFVIFVIALQQFDGNILSARRSWATPRVSPASGWWWPFWWAAASAASWACSWACRCLPASRCW